MTNTIIKIPFYLTWLLFCLGQLGRLSFLNQQINIYLYEFPLILSLFLLVVKFRLDPIKQTLKKYKSVCVFFLTLFISFLLGIYRFKPLENLIGFLYFSRLAMYFLYFFYFGYFYSRNKDFSKIVFHSILFFIVFTIAISLIQYFLYPDLRNLIYLGWDPHLYRAFGVFFDTSIGGAIFSLIFFFLVLNSKEYFKVKYLEGLKYLFLGLVLILIVLTFSRSLYLIFGLVLIYLLLKKKAYKSLIFFAALFFLLIFSAPKPFGEGVNLTRLFSVGSRLNDYKIGLNIWKRHPIFGIGYNRIRYVKETLGLIEGSRQLTHAGASVSSSFLIVLVTGGLLGLLAFGWLLYQLTRISFSAGIYILLLAGLSLFDNVILHPFVFFLLINLLILQ